jgi:hypothetical protein
MVFHKPLSNDGRLIRHNTNINYTQFFVPNICCLVHMPADHSGREVKGMNYLCSLERWDRGFESHSMHECLCAFILSFCCSVCRERPCDGLISRPRSPTDSYRLCIGLRNWKSGQGTTKGCIATDRQIDGKTDRQADRQTDRPTDRETDGWMDRQTDGRTDG